MTGDRSASDGDDGEDGVEHQFQRLVAGLDYPMFVLTAATSDGERSGCLIGFASQCSIHPPRFAVWVSEKNHTFTVARRAGALAVHALGGGQHDLAKLFGSETGDEIDKFARCAWHDGPAGAPVLEGVAGWFVGRVVERLRTGDHLGFVLEPIAAEAYGTPSLGFQDVKDLEPGHDA
jgi:flavin reductase (DIM6/NTAB) family NADH-FMN oxidoreductase RutF